jgi:glycosyltransferase involved in cell wall biosynthesis
METWTYEVARALVRRGHTVVVFTPKLRGHEDDEVMDGIQVRRFGPSSLASTFSELSPYPYLARLPMFLVWLPWRVVQERQFDAVIVTYVSLGFVGLLLRLFHIPTWAIIHGFYGTQAAVESHGALRGMLRITVQDLVLRIPVQGYIVVGEEVRGALVRKGVSENKLSLVRGGVNVDEIDSVHVEKSSAPQICFVGRLIPERRVDELLHSFVLVLKHEPQARLVVVGDGPLRGQWEELARSLKLDRNVRFTGALHGRARFEILKESHVLAHPSIREGMSLTVFEALACSVPVVAYDIPEIREQLGTARGGILVKPHDVEGFTQGVLKLLDDPLTRTKIGARGRMAIRDLDWNSVSERVERVLRL